MRLQIYSQHDLVHLEHQRALIIDNAAASCQKSLQLYLLLQDTHGASHLRRYLVTTQTSTQLSFLPHALFAVPCCRWINTTRIESRLPFPILGDDIIFSINVVGQKSRRAQRLDSRSRSDTVAADIETVSVLTVGVRGRQSCFPSQCMFGEYGKTFQLRQVVITTGSPEIRC